MLADDLYDILFREADREAPNEMCGLIFDPHHFVATKNIAADPTKGFLIDIEEYLALVQKRGSRPWAIVHSHPGAPAYPSPQDCRLMDALRISGNTHAMVIVGLNPRQIKRYRREGDLYKCLDYYNAP